jgi:RND family efflux transporter MFP subunit
MYVSVPQSHMRMMQPNVPVAVTLREFQGKTFEAKVMRTAGALDAQSKTLTTEVHVPNGNGALLAGMYAQVKFSLTQAEPSILIPANTLIVRADGPQVAAVDKEVVQMRKVTLGRDFGTQIEVLSGLNDKELIVTNPTDAMIDGVAVKMVLAPPPKKPGEKPADKPAPKADKQTTNPGQVAEKSK